MNTTNAERIHRVDQDMANCLEALRTLIPASTMSGNLSMVVSAQFVMDALIQYHQEKMTILYNSGATELTNLHQYRTPETPEEIRRRFARDNAHIVMDRTDEEEDDSGPLQLADLMELEGEGGTPTHHDETYNAYLDPNGEEWPTIEADWGQDDEVPPANVHEFEPCNRNQIYLLEFEANRVSQMCTVCFDTPFAVDACITGCGHHYCKGCFSEWENKARLSYEDGHATEVTCPVCRAVRPDVFEFRLPGN